MCVFFAITLFEHTFLCHCSFGHQTGKNVYVDNKPMPKFASFLSELKFAAFILSHCFRVIHSVSHIHDWTVLNVTDWWWVLLWLCFFSMCHMIEHVQNMAEKPLTKFWQRWGVILTKEQTFVKTTMCGTFSAQFQFCCNLLHLGCLDKKWWDRKSSACPGQQQSDNVAKNNIDCRL